MAVNEIIRIFKRYAIAMMLGFMTLFFTTHACIAEGVKLLVIDTALEGVTELTSALPSHTEVLLLNNKRSGFSQIAD